MSMSRIEYQQKIEKLNSKYAIKPKGVNYEPRQRQIQRRKEKRGENDP